MRLRTFESFWLVKNGILHSYPSLQKNIDTEIAVIGGGITGALTSHALVEKGYKVVLVGCLHLGKPEWQVHKSHQTVGLDQEISALLPSFGSYRRRLYIV